MSQSKGVIWAYCRVSSNHQAYGEEESLHTQINRCRLYGATRTFYDVTSRTKSKRDGLSLLLQEIEKTNVGDVTELVFTRLDRLAASQVDFYTLLEALEKKNIKVKAIDDSLDLDSLGGQLSTNIRLLLSKHEVEMLGLRIRKALEYKRQQGVPHKLPKGYVFVDGKIAFDYTPVLCHLEDKLEYTMHDIVKKIFETFDTFKTVNATSKWIHEYFGLYLLIEPKNKKKSTNVVEGSNKIKLPHKTNVGKSFPHCTLRFSRQTINDIFKNPVYAGNVGRDFEHDKPYISQNQFYKNLNTIKKNKSLCRSDRTRCKNEYASFIRCDHCKGVVTRHTNKRKYYLYYCSGARSGGTCTHKAQISKTNLDKLVAQQFRLKAVNLAEASMHMKNEEKKSESKEVRQLKAQISALEQIHPKAEEIQLALKSLKSKLSAEESRDVDLATEDSINRKRFLELFTNLNYPVWEHFTTQERRRFFDLFVECIYYQCGKTILIDWKFID